MNLPDSGWFAVIRKVECWLLAAVTTVAAMTFALAHFNVSWFGRLPATGILATAIVGLMVFCILLFHAIDQAWKSFWKSRAGAL